MIRYPIIVGIGGLRVPFTDAAGLLARYDDIFTPALRDAIARGSSGVVVEIVDGQARITSITVPPLPMKAAWRSCHPSMPRVAARESKNRVVSPSASGRGPRRFQACLPETGPTR